MFRKNYFSIALFIALFTVSGFSVFAQTQTIGGKVELKKEDGSKSPVAGAQVDCYRIDISQGCRSVKTNDEGMFTIIGLPSSAKVVLAVSGEGIAPQVTPNVRMDDSNVLTVSAGDSSVPTEDDVREVARAYASKSGGLTDAQKKELEDLEKKREEIEASNTKITEKNTLREKYSKDGIAARNSKDYDTAIMNFSKGYELDPEFLGSAPVFLNLKADSLKQRGVDKYNSAVKSGDGAMINKAKTDLANDFGEALTATNKAYMMTKNVKGADGANAKRSMEDAQNLTKELMKIMNQVGVTLASNIQSEKDAEDAIAAYKGTLTMLPDNPDVLAGLGIALYISSEFVGNPAQKQESLNYMELYKKTAPKDHKQQQAVNELYEVLTTVEKLKPQKISN